MKPDHRDAEPRETGFRPVPRGSARGRYFTFWRKNASVRFQASAAAALL